jgi:VWFA-related protein
MILRLLVALGSLAVAVGVAQQPLQIVITSPADGSYISDRLLLEASIVPRERRKEITGVTFFADGRLVCRSTNIQAPSCTWDAGPTVKTHMIRVVAETTSGERLVATRRTREIDVNAAVDVRVVQINAAVSDGDGSFVRGLTPDRFRVTEDGRVQNIIHFAAEEAPLEIVMAMDISGSMAGALEELRSAARQFLAKLRPADQVTLVAFNEEMFVLTRRETDAAARADAVDRLSAWGGTTLYDAIIRSLELLSRQQGRRSLILFSDGEDQSSQATFAAVDRALKGSDATLFTVAIGRGRDQASLRETLEALAEPTGGRALFAERAGDLGAVFEELLTELAHQYLIGYESSNVAKDGAWRRLDVGVPGSRYRVRARQGYFAPTQ